MKLIETIAGGFILLVQFIIALLVGCFILGGIVGGLAYILNRIIHG